MLLCNKCGKENKDQSKFCTRCGSRELTSTNEITIARETEITNKTIEQTICGICNTSNKPQSKFCKRCGNELLENIPNLKPDTVPDFPIQEKGHICNICGKQNKTHAKFCIGCGNKFESTLVSTEIKNFSNTDTILNNVEPGIRPTSDPGFKAPTKEVILSELNEHPDTIPVKKHILFDKPAETIKSIDTYDLPKSDLVGFISNETKSKDEMVLSEQPEPITFESFEEEPTPETQAEEDLLVYKTEEKLSFYAEAEIPREKPISGSHSLLENPVDEKLEGLTTDKFEQKEEITIPESEYEFSQVKELKNNSGVIIAEDEEEVQPQVQKTEAIEASYVDEEFEYPQPKKRKYLYWLIPLVLLTGVSAFLFSSVLTGNKKHTKNINPSDSDKNKPVLSLDSTSGDINRIIVKTDSANKTNTSEKKTTADKTIEVSNTLPLPTYTTAIADLEGKLICDNVFILKKARITSYRNQVLNNEYGKGVIAFRLGNNSTNYTVTMLYQKTGNEYKYHSHTCSSNKPAEVVVVDPPKPTQPSKPPPIVGDKNVKEDLINYLKNKKTFCGVQYNDISEIAITNVGNKVYYAEYGNTSYIIDLNINNLSRRCQVNYTNDGKFTVTALR